MYTIVYMSQKLFLKQSKSPIINSPNYQLSILHIRLLNSLILLSLASSLITLVWIILIIIIIVLLMIMIIWLLYMWRSIMSMSMAYITLENPSGYDAKLQKIIRNSKEEQIRNIEDIKQLSTIWYHIINHLCNGI